MAPDLNSVPPSPRNVFRSPQTSTASSRRTSQPMGPPPAPVVDAGSRSSHVTRDGALLAPMPVMAPQGVAADNTGVGVGPGPLRHPRPLTAADLHLQLEQEQEAVVNRLTRELSLLRQQSASVVSTTSSTSTGPADLSDHNPNNMLFGASHPTPARRHRSSSSSLSTRSVNAAIITNSTVTGIAPARDSTIHASNQNRDTLSRHNSVASSRRSEASSPSLSSSLLSGDHFPTTLPQRQSFILPHGHGPASHVTQQTTNASSTRVPNNSSAIVSLRYDEAANHRSELEAARQENEVLRQRIKDLECRLSGRRQSGHSRTPSEAAIGSSANAGASRSGSRINHRQASGEPKGED